MIESHVHLGRITLATAGSLEAIIPDVPLGAIVQVERPRQQALYAEVIGLKQSTAQLAPWSDPQGVRVGASAEMIYPQTPSIHGENSKGRVLSPLGKDLYTNADIQSSTLPPQAPRFSQRVASHEQLLCGIPSVDMLLPIVEGQRIGIFAGAGVGKTTLLTQLANQLQCDRTVIALIGERAREAVSLAAELKTLPSWKRTTMIVSTSDDPAAIRVRAAWAAMEIAQEARKNGEKVLFLLDSFTRWVRARRDLALLAGERAGRGGFPPSAFAAMAPLVEAAGADRSGSITAFFTVLLEGDTMEDPIGDEARGLVEGHWILERKLAERGVFPAIHIPSSLSRLASDVFNEAERTVYQRLRHAYALLETIEESERFGLYTPGLDPIQDHVRTLRQALWDFQKQAQDHFTPWEQTQEHALALFHALGDLSV